MEDSRRNVHQIRSSKEYTTTTKRWNNNSNSKKKKRQLVKVVYISNPMHFKASAAEFKGLVQHFTGQDSDVDAELFKFAGAEHDSPVDVDADGASSFSTDDDSAAALSRPAAAGAAVEQHQQQEEEEPYKLVGGGTAAVRRLRRRLLAAGAGEPRRLHAHGLSVLRLRAPPPPVM